MDQMLELVLLEYLLVVEEDLGAMCVDLQVDQAVVVMVELQLVAELLQEMRELLILEEEVEVQELVQLPQRAQEQEELVDQELYLSKNQKYYQAHLECGH